MIQESVGSILPHWESFYVIIGSSAGALTGLQFVVIALIAESRQPTSFGQIDAFGTPTIVHFCVVLLISAILSAPWPSLRGVAWLLGAVSVGGITYTTIVLLRTRRVTGYKPVLEDWIWHVALPLLSYVILLAAALTFDFFSTVALFLTGAVNLLLLFVGIHNAWDTVTFIVVKRLSTEGKSEADSHDHIGEPAYQNEETIVDS